MPVWVFALNFCQKFFSCLFFIARYTCKISSAVIQEIFIVILNNIKIDKNNFLEIFDVLQFLTEIKFGEKTNVIGSNMPFFIF